MYIRLVYFIANSARCIPYIVKCELSLELDLREKKKQNKKMQMSDEKEEKGMPPDRIDGSF